MWAEGQENGLKCAAHGGGEDVRQRLEGAELNCQSLSLSCAGWGEGWVVEGIVGGLVVDAFCMTN